MGPFVGLGDYPADSPVVNQMSGQEFATLQKALVTGQGIVAEGATGGQAFRVQSLEQTLKVATEASEKELPLWSKFSKLPANSTTIEYTRQDDWGDSGDGGNFFDGEIADLSEQEATYTRLAAMVKYLVVKKEVSFASTLVNSIVSPMAQKAHEGTLQILRAAEFGFFYGNSTYNPLAFDGFIKQIDAVASGDNADIVIDWKGNPPSEDMLEQAGRVVADHFGYLDYMVMGTRAKSDLTRAMFPNQRINMPPNAEGRVGSPLHIYEGSNSTMEVKGSRYVRNFRPRATGMTGAPGAISAVTAATDAESTSELEAKTYYYWVSACYRGFESAPVAVGAVTPAVGEKITLSIANGAWDGSAPAATYARIYRSTDINSTANATLIAQVARVADDTTTWEDLNQSRDNCTDAVGLTFTPEVLALRQLAPLMKMDLAQVTTSLPFLLLLYCVPILFVPTKCVRIKNIGVLPLS